MRSGRPKGAEKEPCRRLRFKILLIRRRFGATAPLRQLGMRSALVSPMNQNRSLEKVKPFRLVKYFTFTSLVVIFLGTVVLALSNTRWARSLQLTKSEDYALVLVENLNHQVFLQFIIPTALKYGKIQLRDQEQVAHLDRVVRSTLHSFQVELVNIYDMNNTIAYSYDETLIGKKNAGGTGYINAVAGRTTSRLVQRGNFFRLALGFPEASRPTRAGRWTPARCSVSWRSSRTCPRTTAPFFISRSW